MNENGELDESVDYYQLLDIPRDASTDEIKKAYRKAALQWHPDRNIENLEVSTRNFQLIEHAYATLIDAQKRDNYDKKIKNYQVEKRGSSAIDFSKYEFDADLFRKHGITDGYKDTYYGFFSVIGRKFYDYAKKEDIQDSAPTFGFSDSEFQHVDDFYKYWLVFSSSLIFDTLDADLGRAANASIRRAWAKNNRKNSEIALRQYNDTVRQLANFAKSWDPRLKRFQEIIKAERHQKKMMEEEKRNIERQEFLKSMEEYQNDAIERARNNLVVEPEATSYDWECEFCQKRIRTGRAFVAHCKTKLHRRNTAKLREQFFNDPKSFGHTAMMYALLNLTDEEISCYGDPTIKVDSLFSTDTKHTAEKVNVRGSSNFSFNDTADTKPESVLESEEDEIETPKRQNIKKRSNKKNKNSSKLRDANNDKKEYFETKIEIDQIETTTGGKFSALQNVDSVDECDGVDNYQVSSEGEDEVALPSEEERNLDLKVNECKDQNKATKKGKGKKVKKKRHDVDRLGDESRKFLYFFIILFIFMVLYTLNKVASLSSIIRCIFC